MPHLYSNTALFHNARQSGNLSLTTSTSNLCLSRTYRNKLRAKTKAVSFYWGDHHSFPSLTMNQTTLSVLEWCPCIVHLRISIPFVTSMHGWQHVQMTKVNHWKGFRRKVLVVSHADSTLLIAALLSTLKNAHKTPWIARYCKNKVWLPLREEIKNLFITPSSYYPSHVKGKSC